MRRTVLFILAAPIALALAACNGADSPEADGADGASTDAAATDVSSGTSADPDTPVSSAATPAPAPTATATTATATRDVDSNPPGDECGASQVAAFVAQVATPAVRSRLAAEVGHSRIRWIGPDTAVTMDFSPTRLNVNLDGNNVITGGRCG